MKSKIFVTFVLILFMNFCEAQISEMTSYRFEGRLESPKFPTYNINILTLKTDNTYNLVYQTYGSKKLAVKGDLLKKETEEGSWEIKDSLLILISNNNQELIFCIKNKNKISVVTSGDDKSKMIWKKIRID